MMISSRLVLSLFLVCLGCNPGNPTPPPADQGETVRGQPLHILRFTEDGSPTDAGATVEGMLAVHEGSAPTDIFIMAHGWNNSESTAIDDLYKPMVDRMATVADQNPGIRPNAYHPMIIGVRWPSLAWPDEAIQESTFAVLPSNLDEILQVNFPDATDQERVALKAFLEKPTPTEEEFRSAVTIMARNLQQAENEPTELTLLDDLAADPSGPQREGVVSTLRDRFMDPRNVARVFTYWQMKRRAGIVGERGLQPVLIDLQEKLPNARFHLIGHSFGCRLILSACRKDRAYALTRHIDTIVLLQGAISHQSFASDVTGASERGGFHATFFNDGGQANAGVIVATHSNADVPLRMAYPLASRLARQGGETEAASRFAAMGAVGIQGLDAAHLVPRRMHAYLADSAEGYEFNSDKRAFYSVNAQGRDGHYFIASHSGIQNMDVAWLIWSAIRRR